MKEGLGLILLLALLAFGIVSCAHTYSSCEEAHGRVVKNATWNTYECVEKGEH